MIDISTIRREGFYAGSIAVVRQQLANRDSLARKEAKLTAQLSVLQKEYIDLLDAQKLLSSVSDDNTEKTLNYITGIVNKVLAEMFKTDVPRIKLTRKLYAGSRPHINVELMDGSGNTLNMKLQSGVGLTQVVSFMFAICLIEIRKGRRLLIMDERLNGLHKEAKNILIEVIKIFAKGGFQFIFVEYGLNDIGKLYNVEKHGDDSILRAVGVDETYTDNTVYVGGDVDLSILDDDIVEE